LVVRDRIPQERLYLAWPAVPFFDWANHEFVGSGGYVATSSVLVLGLGVFALIRVAAKRSRPVSFDALDAAVLLFGVLSSGVILIAAARHGATSQRFAWLVWAHISVVVYFLVRRSLATPTMLRSASSALAIGLILMCLIGLIEFVVLPLDLQTIPGSTYQDADDFSVYLAMAAPFLLSLAVLGRGRQRWLTWPAALLAITLVVITWARACWVSTAVTISLVALATAARRDWLLGVSALLFALGVGLLGARAVASAGSSGYSSPFLREVMSIARPHSFRRARAHAIRVGIDRVKQSPILGQPGTWVDNYFLTMGANYGLPVGGLALLVVCYAVGRGIWSSWRIRDPMLFALAVGAVSGMTGAMLDGMAEPGCSRPGYIPLFWFLIATVPIALRRVGTGPADVSPPAPASNRPPPHSAAASTTAGPTAPVLRRSRRRRFPTPERPSRWVMLGVMLACLAGVAAMLWLVFR
jgi:hypothetical protein